MEIIAGKNNILQSLQLVVSQVERVLHFSREWYKGTLPFWVDQIQEKVISIMTLNDYWFNLLPLLRHFASGDGFR